MARAHSDIDEIPINQDVMTRYVSWIMALLVYLLCLVLAGAVSISSSLDKWCVGMNARFTIMIPLSHELDRERIVPSVLSLLKSNPGVRQVNALDKIQRQSWMPEEITLPQHPFALIEVDLDRNHPMDMNDLVASLYQIAPGLKVEAQGRWQDVIAVLHTSLQIIAYIFAVLIALTVIITITLVTQSGLAAHQETISILRLIGAQNSYISRKFQAHALKLAFRGAIIGSLMAIPTLMALNYLSGNLGVSDVLKPGLDFTLFLVILAIPLAVVFLSICVARFAVFKTLAQLC